MCACDVVGDWTLVWWCVCGVGAAHGDRGDRVGPAPVVAAGVGLGDRDAPLQHLVHEQKLCRLVKPVRLALPHVALVAVAVQHAGAGRRRAVGHVGGRGAEEAPLAARLEVDRLRAVDQLALHQ